MAESASGLPFPAQLELKRGNLAENWKKFQRVWDNYEIASGLVEKDAKLRKATLLTCLGADAIELFETFPLSEDDRKDPAKIIDAFKSHCIGVTNETYERYNFNARTQEPGESIDGYTSVLRTLAKTCNYGVLEESLIRDRMVIGIRDNGTRKKLLQEKDLTLNRCIDICRANEKTDEQLKSINSEDVAVVYKQKDKKDKKSNVSKPKPNVRECWFCGNKHAPNKESCPAYGEKCNLCGGMNHFARKCKKVKEKKEKKQKKKGKVHLVNQSAESTDSEDDYCFIVDEAGKYPKKLFAKVLINNHQVKCQLDCGATVNILSDTDYMRVCDDQWMDKLVKSSVQLVMYNKTHIKTLGKRKLKVRNPKNKKDYTLEFVVVQGSVQPLLGAQALQMMDFITVNREHILAVNVSQSSETLIEEYKDVFEGEGKLQGKLHLELEPNSKPVKQPVRKVPVAVKPRLKKEIDRLVKLGMIEEVKQPTEWISSMVVVNKSNNKVRLCLDPKPLNKCLKRNNYPIPTIEDILPELSNAKIFTVADAKNGFWHVDLDSESSDLLTFGTPWGRYKWKRMAFGISVAPEEFQRRIDEALEGLEGVKAIHDDILIWGSGKSEEEAIEDHDQKLATLLQRCREKGLKLNRDKLKLKQKEVSFMGHVISNKGLQVDETKIKAIKEMPYPKDKQGVQRLLGMVNYVQKFAPKLSEITDPLRQLIKKENEFHWDSTHDKCVKEIKEMLSTTPVLKYFDAEKDTVLQCDASEQGLGACLLQEGHPIVYASRALTSAERNYAQIEKELLAIVFGVERFEQYVYGRHVKVESDHKPLEIISKKSLVTAPKRLQRMLLRLQKFDIDIQYKKGTEMYLADTLSRAFLSESNQSFTEEEVENVNVVELINVSKERIAEVKEATKDDHVLQKLIKIVNQGWPDLRDECPGEIQVYYPFREQITVQDGIVFKEDRVIVPSALKYGFMDRIHSSHIGIQGCLRRAREVLYWPNMNQDVEKYIQTCDVCNKLSQNQSKETLISHDIPSRPWEVVGIDLFEFEGRDYVITVDYLTNIFEVDKLDDKTGSGVIPKLKAHFARYGLPEKVVSDNGPPFSGKEFSQFAKLFEFRHQTSSPGYPQSNGKVENAVKTAKKLMKKAKESGSDPYLGLLDFRNTPNECAGLSPVQMMFGRRTRTLLSLTRKSLESSHLNDSNTKIRHNLEKGKAKQAYYYNKTAKDLKTLREGDTVRVKPMARNQYWKKGIVEDQVDNRSFKVRMEDGTRYRRNRKHLRLTSEQFHEHDYDQYSHEHDIVDKSSCSMSGKEKALERKKQIAEFFRSRQNEIEIEEQKQRKLSSIRPIDKNTEADPSLTNVQENGYKTRSGRIVKKPNHLKE